MHQLHRPRAPRFEPEEPKRDMEPTGRGVAPAGPRAGQPALVRRVERPITSAEPPASAPAVSRIKQAAFTTADSNPIPRTELVKGFEYDKDRYVVIEEEDLKKITPKTAKDMQILEFVKLEQIDPLYLETSYYVAPEPEGEKPYALLFAALRQTGYAGLAEFAMHGRDHIVILRAGKQGILAHTMYYEDEIRKTQEFRADASLVTKKEQDLAVLLIDALATNFEPQKYKDTFRERLQEMIEAKLKGSEVVEMAAPKAAEVVDITDALRKSLARLRKPMGASGSAAPSAEKSRERRRSR